MLRKCQNPSAVVSVMAMPSLPIKHDYPVLLIVLFILKTSFASHCKLIIGGKLFRSCNITPKIIKDFTPADCPVRTVLPISNLRIRKALNPGSSFAPLIRYALTFSL